MAKLILDLNKSIEQNASFYFDKAKKLKKKLAGAQEALNKNYVMLAKIEKEKEKEKLVQQQKKEEVRVKKEWYEKFRWFISSEGFLVIGGRDATTNEIVIKKHTSADDLVFHTDMAGSPFFVVKSEGNKVGEATIKEVADATCSFSRAFRMGLNSTPVFYVHPDQVSQEAPSGEYLQKGSFMIRGKTNYSENKVNVAVGLLDDGRIMAAPIEAVEKHCKKYVLIVQGNSKTSEVAKKIKAKIGGSLDDIIRVLPAGGIDIAK